MPRQTASTSLTRSQGVLMAALELNQIALVDQLSAMLAPLQLKVEVLSDQLAALSRQIDQLHAHQAASERRRTEGERGE